MDLAEQAKLIVELDLRDNLARGISGAKRELSGLGAAASKGVHTAATNIARIAAVGAVALVGAVKEGLDSLSSLEDATASVDGALKQMGLTGVITGKLVAGWAHDIETAVGGAFDDTAITQAATTLIRFGHITATNLRPAMQVMTDLATKTGSVDSAATLLAKALADPEKAAGKLARAGVILTQSQQDQIKAMVAAGDAAGAQKVLLDALTLSTQGAAAASQGPYRTALNTLKDTWRDLTRVLAVGFLPVIEEVAGYLKGKLADPAFLDKVKGFGQDLAGFLRDAFEAAKKIPWSSIGDAMKLAGQGAKAAYDLFNGLPDWVKTAVITGWGLNKLTGGALSSIVGALGSGLIKGVLGMTAGVVNINAASVNGGVGGAAGKTGAAGFLNSKLGTLVSLGSAVVTVAILADQFNQLKANVAAQSAEVLGNIPKVALQSFSQALSNTKGLAVGLNTQAKDLFTSLLMKTGSGVKEATASFDAFAKQLMATASTPAEKAQAAQAINDLYTAITTQTDALTYPDYAKVLVGDMTTVASWAANPNVALAPASVAAIMSGFKTGMAGAPSIISTVQSGATATASGIKDLIAQFDTNKNGLLGLREVLADKLGISNDQLMKLENDSKGGMSKLAGLLGISKDKLQTLIDDTNKVVGSSGNIKNLSTIMAQHLGVMPRHLQKLIDESGGINSTLANKLGISNDRLQSIKTESKREKDAIDAARRATQALKLDPTINVNVASGPFRTGMAGAPSQISTVSTVSLDTPTINQVGFVIGQQVAPSGVAISDLSQAAIKLASAAGAIPRAPSGPLGGGGGIFKPTVKLDPSQVNDMRSAPYINKLGFDIKQTIPPGLHQVSSAIGSLIGATHGTTGSVQDVDLTLRKKKFDPTIVVNNTIRTNAYISGRSVYDAVQRQRLVSGKQVE